jgi:hypothetical protein
VPVAIDDAGERDPARDIETERHRRQQLLAGDAGDAGDAADAADAVAKRRSRAKHRDAGMDRAAGVECVVEIERVPHAGVQECSLWRRQADTAQQHAAFGRSAPSGDHREKLADPGRTAAAEHAAEGVEDVTAGGFDGARGQVAVPSAADMCARAQAGSSVVIFPAEVRAPRILSAGARVVATPAARLRYRLQ